MPKITSDCVLFLLLHAVLLVKSFLCLSLEKLPSVIYLKAIPLLQEIKGAQRPGKQMTHCQGSKARRKNNHHPKPTRKWPPMGNGSANSISEKTYRPPYHTSSCQEEASNSPTISGKHGLGRKCQKFNRKLERSNLASQEDHPHPPYTCTFFNPLHFLKHFHIPYFLEAQKTEAGTYI